MLIFKGKPGGRIETKEFTQFPPVCVLACQAKAWMDKKCMIQWVDECLSPHVATAPPGIVPLLALDAHQCHMMKSVVNRIQALGVEVEIIPGVCMGHCQPLDVGLNKPLKVRIAKEWEEWMFDEGILCGKAVPPTLEVIVHWTIDSWRAMKESTIINSWRHGDYSWFD